jgi:hypothetical protein
MKRITLLVALIFSLAGCTRAQQNPVANTTTPSAPNSAAAPGGFLVHNNDVWVQAGDSITWQALYTTYLEAFIRARYPKLSFVAVNSGKSGEVTIQGIIRFRGTMAAFKPTLITSAYGMNDHVKVFGPGGNFLDDPRSAPQRFADEVKKVGARYAIISASPLLQPMEDESTFKAADGTWIIPKERTNFVNKQFADQVKIVAERNGIPYLDQMTPLLQIWTANYERDRVAAIRHAIEPFLAVPLTVENLLAFTNAFKPYQRDSALPLEKLPLPDKDNFLAQMSSAARGDLSKWEVLRQYLVGWAKLVDESTLPFVQVSGYTNSSRAIDLIHPNEAGHLQMAALVFRLMGGDDLVSDVAIDARSAKVVKATKASVRDISSKAGVLSFKRLDESLPLPIDALSRPALNVAVDTELGNSRNLFGTSRYLLQISNLPFGQYSLAIDDEEVARYSAAELAKGVDLGLIKKGPVYEQTQKLLEAVRANVVMAVPEKGQAMVGTNVAPKVVPEALPVEHTWTLRPVK